MKYVKRRDLLMLKGSKTMIRPLAEEDGDDFYRWYNDQEVNLWSSGAWPLSTLLSRDELMEKFFNGDDNARYIITDEKDKPIGTIGFRELNIPARSAVLFIVIGEKAYWDKGYGSDALKVFLRYLFCQWNLHRISLDTWDGNIRAIKAYEKVGFQIEGRLRQARYVNGEYKDAVVMGLLKDDFLRLPNLDK